MRFNHCRFLSLTHLKKKKRISHFPITLLLPEEEQFLFLFLFKMVLFEFYLKRYSESRACYASIRRDPVPLEDRRDLDVDDNEERPFF